MLEILNRIALAANAPTDTELARRLGMSQQSVAKARTTKNVPSSWLIKASTLFGVSLDWLYYGTPPMRVRTAEKADCPDRAELPLGRAELPLGRAELPLGRTELPLDRAELPLAEDIHAALTTIPKVNARLAAGTSTLEASEDVTPLYTFCSDWIKRKGTAKHMVLMNVTGNAMTPDICHGDMVLIDQSQKAVLGYGYFAISIDDTVYIKQLRSKPGKLILHSLNSDYADIEVGMPTDSPQSVRILGRVVWVGRELV